MPARVFTSILGDGSREGDGYAYFDQDFNPPCLVRDGFGDRGRRLDRPRLGGGAPGGGRGGRPRRRLGRRRLPRRRLWRRRLSRRRLWRRRLSRRRLWGGRVFPGGGWRARGGG